MATRSILLAVADPQTLVDINQALGSQWEAVTATSPTDVMAHLQERSFDAFLVDFNLGSPDASELLNFTLERHPETVRFLLAYEADLALVAAKVLESPQIISKPVEIESLKTRIESGVTDAHPEQNGSEPANDASNASTVPPVYAEVLKALDQPNVTNEQVGKIISRDAALTAELLRLTRSAYMGLPRNVTDPAEAVESLGLIAVKSLVMALRFLAEHSHLNPGYLSLPQIWQHSANVAQIARDLTLFETKDRALASHAFAAGLLHDLGKVVLVTNFDDLYGRVHSLARKQPVPLWDIEKEMFGASHGEIGACLLGMWNLPASIIDAAAFHHEPPLGEHDRLNPLAAVHIANVLERELRPGDEFRVAPVINTSFLNELGLLQRLPVWRASSANRRSPNQPAETEMPDSTEGPLSSKTGNVVPFPGAESWTAASAEMGEDSSDSSGAVPRPGFGQMRWVYASIVAGVLLLLFLWLKTQQNFDEAVPIYARTATTNQAPAVSEPAPETNAAPATVVASVPSPSEALPVVDNSFVPEPEVPQSAPEPSPATIPEVIATNVPPSLPPKEIAQPDFRLNAIIYSVKRPSAILNGQTVYVGDQVNGATVLSIHQTEVTIDLHGQRKTFTLR